MRILLGLFLILSFVFVNVNAFANDSFLEPDQVANKNRPEVENLDIEEHLGEDLDLNLMFTNEEGQSVPLSTYFNKGKPVLLNLVYFECPSLCNFHLNGLTEVFKTLDWSIGEKYDVVTISFEAKEGHELAKSKKESYVKAYGRVSAKESWHFLTGSEASIQKIAQQVGFKFRWNEEQKEWAHPAAAYIITPEGKISRYLYGIGFDSKTLKLSLLEAANGKIGTIVDRFMMFCYKYDPNKKSYGFYAFNLMRVAAGLTVIILFITMGSFWIRQRRSIRNTIKGEG